MRLTLIPSIFLTVTTAATTTEFIRDEKHLNFETTVTQPTSTKRIPIAETVKDPSNSSTTTTTTTTSPTIIQTEYSQIIAKTNNDSNKNQPETQETPLAPKTQIEDYTSGDSPLADDYSTRLPTPVESIPSPTDIAARTKSANVPSPVPVIDSTAPVNVETTSMMRHSGVSVPVPVGVVEGLLDRTPVAVHEIDSHETTTTAAPETTGAREMPGESTTMNSLPAGMNESTDTTDTEMGAAQNQTSESPDDGMRMSNVDRIVAQVASENLQARRDSTTTTSLQGHEDGEQAPSSVGGLESSPVYGAGETDDSMVLSNTDLAEEMRNTSTSPVRAAAGISNDDHHEKVMDDVMRDMGLPHLVKGDTSTTYERSESSTEAQNFDNSSTEETESENGDGGAVESADNDYYTSTSLTGKKTVFLAMRTSMKVSRLRYDAHVNFRQTMHPVRKLFGGFEYSDGRVAYWGVTLKDELVRVTQSSMTGGGHSTVDLFKDIDGAIEDASITEVRRNYDDNETPEFRIIAKLRNSPHSTVTVRMVDELLYAVRYSDAEDSSTAGVLVAIAGEDELLVERLPIKPAYRLPGDARTIVRCIGATCNITQVSSDGNDALLHEQTYTLRSRTQPGVAGIRESVPSYRSNHGEWEMVAGIRQAAAPLDEAISSKRVIPVFPAKLSDKRLIHVVRDNGLIVVALSPPLVIQDGALKIAADIWHSSQDFTPIETRATEGFQAFDVGACGTTKFVLRYPAADFTSRGFTGSVVLRDREGVITMVAIEGASKWYSWKTYASRLIVHGGGLRRRETALIPHPAVLPKYIELIISKDGDLLEVQFADRYALLLLSTDPNSQSIEFFQSRPRSVAFSTQVCPAGKRAVPWYEDFDHLCRCENIVAN